MSTKTIQWRSPADNAPMQAFLSEDNVYTLYKDGEKITECSGDLAIHCFKTLEHKAKELPTFTD